MMTPTRVVASGLAALALMGVRQADALEGGPAGTIAGVDQRAGQLPPVGWYVLTRPTYSWSKVRRDNAGNEVQLREFSSRVSALTSDVLYSSPVSLLNGRLGLTVGLPIILRGCVEPGQIPGGPNAGRRIEGNCNREEAANPNLKVIWASNPVPVHDRAALFYSFGPSYYFNTQRYHTNRYVKAAPNYDAFELESSATLRFGDGWDATGRLQYYLPLDSNDVSPGANQALGTVNGRYRDGRLFNFGWGISKALSPSWVVGINGYSTRQTSDDRFTPYDGSACASPQACTNGRFRVDAVGPFFQYNFAGPAPGKLGPFITVKFHRQFNASNTTEGNQIGARLGFPLNF